MLIIVPDTDMLTRTPEDYGYQSSENSSYSDVIDSTCNCYNDVVIGGVLPMYWEPNSYLSAPNSNGELYEAWYDGEGWLKHMRHHSDHFNPKNHMNPHDHWGIDNGNGGRKLSGPKEKDPDYRSPDALDDAVTVGESILTAYVLYMVLKIGIGIIAAPATGGMSFITAVATP
jgi:hypothetical protein